MEYKNKLLSDLASEKITLPQLLKECAMWYLDCFDTIYPRPEPSMPNEYRDYLHLPFEKKQKTPSEFWLKPVIRDYLEIKQKIKNENMGTLLNLKEHLSHIPEGDFVSIQKFKDKIQVFNTY